MTPLCDKNNCDALVICAFVPLVCVTTNFVLTPSRATLKVCDVPEPSVVKFIAVPEFAFEALVAN